MDRGELHVGKTTTTHRCERCLTEIAVGELATFHRSTKTFSHFRCELRARRTRP